MKLTEEIRNNIRQGYGNGLTAKEIATSLGISIKQVYREASKKKLKSAHFYSSEELSTIRSMHSNGYSVADIAKAINRPVPGLERKICALGLNSGFFYTDDEKDKIRALGVQGLSAKEIANHFPTRDTASIRRQLSDMGFGRNDREKLLLERKQRRMTKAQHNLFCDYLRSCASGKNPVPAEEICRFWNLKSSENGLPKVKRDKVEYWLKKLKLAYVSGKMVKEVAPEFFRLRVLGKVKTLHLSIAKTEKLEEEELEILASELRKEGSYNFADCPRCHKNLPIHPSFFYISRTKNGKRIPRVHMCILCQKRYRRKIADMKRKGAKPEEIHTFRKAESRKAREWKKENM
ncbi:MAG TPA: hypothetical protein PKA63_11205 [Oligoflexia bacterium]|nr:hypothetical protein [Oligoflexia bacterium]HMP49226.1 hypothetical protein [Oligoflexia bacterium]